MFKEKPLPLFEPSEKALAIFARFLAETDGGGRRSVHAFLSDYLLLEAGAIQAHDAALLAKDLERLHDEWSDLKPASPPAKGSAGWFQYLQSVYGNAVKSESGARTPGGATAETTETPPADPHRYQFRGRIESGGMGVVWRVFDKNLRRHLAMKMMKEPLSTSPGAGTSRTTMQERRFIEEAHITGQLDHPGIVPVHELSQDTSRRAFFTMKLVRGRDLKNIFEELYQNGAEPDSAAIARLLRVLLKVCDALSYAHDKGVIHRDLKPANIMVGRFGEVHVMDWGVARVLQKKDLFDMRIAGAPATDSVLFSGRRDLRESDPDSPLITMDGSVVGTPAYMAPEQAMGMLDRVGIASDIYSLGAVLYHLLSGTMPYVAPGARMSQRALLVAVVQGPPPSPSTIRPGLPAQLIAICEKAMSRDPAGRYPSASDLAADIEAFLDARPVAARDATTRETLTLLYQRNRGAVHGTLAAAVLFIVTTGWFLFHLQFEVGAKTRALEEVATWRSGLDASRLLEFDTEHLAPLDARRVAETARWIDAAQKLVRELPARRLDVSQLSPSDPDRAARTRVVELLEQLQIRTAVAEQQFRLARTAADRTTRAHAAAWNAAIAHIAADARFHKFICPPVPGLVPLRPDPASGFYEFYAPDTGAAPVVDPATGIYIINEETGMVFILLPGGPVTRGRAPLDESEIVFADEIPRNFKLSPFFISKYETTQAQWLRVMEGNPSDHKPGRPALGIHFSLVHPVESIDHSTAAMFARRAGFSLPTETQWEYAASGDQERMPWELEPGKFITAENLLDANYYSATGAAAGPETNDRFALHAPVGSYISNPFGLHDALGNVAEWCEDWYSPEPPEQNLRGDGLVECNEREHRVFRGGDFKLSEERSTATFRRHQKPGYKAPHLGVRVLKNIMD